MIHTNPTLGPGGTQQMPTLTVAQPTEATLSNDNGTIITTNPYILPLFVVALTVMGISTGFLFGDLQKNKKHRN